MTTAVDLVARHLEAFRRSDWAVLAQTVSPKAALTISRGTWTHSDWEIGGFYRNISQAWDFIPKDIQLFDRSDGVVKANIHLTNGGDWAKDITGEYRVSGDKIDCIEIIDSTAYQLTQVDKNRGSAEP